MDQSLLPQVVSMSVLRTRPPEGIRHRHACDEVCLFAEGTCTAIHAGRELVIRGDTLVLFRRGEEHGFHTAPGDAITLWVLHYQVDDALLAECPALAARDPAKRIWRLDGPAATAWQELFRRVLSERMAARPGSASAVSAWLRLLLVSVARLGEAGSPAAVSSPAVATATAIDDPEVMALFTLIQQHQGDPARLIGVLHRRVPNYDAVRHRFRRAYGLTPAELLRRHRLEQAKHLLLESELTIGAIAERLGYARSHEFSRTFHRATGSAPGTFRRHGGFREG